MTVATTTHTAALTAAAACAAGTGWRTELVDGYPKERLALCGQVVGLRHYTDVAGMRRSYCALAGHEDNVRRRFAEHMYRDARTGDRVPAGDFGQTAADVDAIVEDFRHHGGMGGAR